MLEVFLRILAVFGIALLAILFAAVTALLLALFWPVTYRVRGTKSGDDVKLSVRMDWLFGILRLRYSYPQPCLLTVKLLWFRLLGKKLPGDGAEETKEKTKEKPEKEKPGRQEKAKKAPAEKADEDPEETGKLREAESAEEAQKESAPESVCRLREQDPPEETRGDREKETGGSPEEPREENETEKEEEAGQEDRGNGETSRAGGVRGRISEIFEKIKYTICNIYDKIKEIWKNISYYAELLQEEKTKQLFAHGKLRVFKILKNIRPRRVRADILFGTGAPDTTGYAYGAYCMISPFLGTKCHVTPDFEKSVLEGRLDMSGHVTVFVLVRNVLMLVFDRKFRPFIRKMKRQQIRTVRDQEKKKQTGGE